MLQALVSKFCLSEYIATIFDDHLLDFSDFSVNTVIFKPLIKLMFA